MPQTVPAIYSPQHHSAQLDFASRFGAASLAMGCLGVLLIAAWLQPSPTGMATHLGLRMQRCGFLEQTGIPCPSCGMTTSFAHFARGNLAASFYVQPMGCLLATLTAATFWIAFYIALTGRPATRLLRVIPARYYLVPFLVFGVAAWIWKIYIHKAGIDGW